MTTKTRQCSRAVRDLLAEVGEHVGVTVELEGRGKHPHLVVGGETVRVQGGRPLVVPLSPSDHRSLKNYRSVLRRLDLLPSGGSR